MGLIVHQKIADLYRALNLPIEQDIDFTIHFLPAIHKHQPFKSPVFRAEYFSFVFVKQGYGQYIIDEQQFPFSDHTIYFTNPGHIKAFHIESVKDAYIITLTESFLRENVHPDIFAEFPFLLAETVPPKTLASHDYAEFETLYQQLYKECQADSVYKSKLMGNLFVVLLLKIKERFWLDYNPINEGDRNSQIVKSFLKFLEQAFTKATLPNSQYQPLQAQDFANALNLHPNYLNSVIKSKTGKTINEWVSARLLSIAKALLVNTNYTAKEIAYRLGFSEATHFSRFFRKHTKATPSQYKKAHQK